MSNAKIISFGTKGWRATSNVGGSPWYAVDGHPYTWWQGTNENFSIDLYARYHNQSVKSINMSGLALDGVNFRSATSIRIRAWSDDSLTNLVYDNTVSNPSWMGYSWYHDFGSTVTVEAIRITVTGADRSWPIITHIIGGIDLQTKYNFSWGHTLNRVDRSRVITNSNTGLDHVIERHSGKKLSCKFEFLSDNDAAEFIRLFGLRGKVDPVYIASYPNPQNDVESEHNFFAYMSNFLGPTRKRAVWSISLVANEVGTPLKRWEKYDDPMYPRESLLIHALDKDNSNMMVPIVDGRGCIYNNGSVANTLWHNGDYWRETTELPWVDGTSYGPVNEVFDTGNTCGIPVTPIIRNWWRDNRNWNEWSESDVTITVGEIDVSGENKATKIEDSNTSVTGYALFNQGISTETQYMSSSTLPNSIELWIKKDSSATHTCAIVLQGVEWSKIVFKLDGSGFTVTSSFGSPQGKISIIGDFLRVQLEAAPESGLPSFGWYSLSMPEVKLFPSYGTVSGYPNEDSSVTGYIVLDAPAWYVDYSGVKSIVDKNYPILITNNGLDGGENNYSVSSNAIPKSGVIGIEFRIESEDSIGSDYSVLFSLHFHKFSSNIGIPKQVVECRVKNNSVYMVYEGVECGSNSHTINTGVKYKMAVAFDGNSKKCTLYVDGAAGTESAIWPINMHSDTILGLNLGEGLKNRVLVLRKLRTMETDYTNAKSTALSWTS